MSNISQIEDLELIIRWRLGQRDFEGNGRKDHLRFDMGFETYTTTKDDPILGLFRDIINPDYNYGTDIMIILRFWKGEGHIYIDQYNTYTLIEPEHDNLYGKGTVDIIKFIIESLITKFPNISLNFDNIVNREARMIRRQIKIKQMNFNI